MAGVGGAQTTVLTAPDGHTLYFFTPDTAGGKPTCTGRLRLALAGPDGDQPHRGSGAKGALTVVSGQVVYNGHPLYEYTGTAPPARPTAKASWASGTPRRRLWPPAADTMPVGRVDPVAGSSGGSGDGGSADTERPPGRG